MVLYYELNRSDKALAKFKHNDAVDIVAQALVSYDFDVSATHEKDFNIDIIAEHARGWTLKIVVRVVTLGSYTWVEQSKFNIYDEKLFIAALYLKSENDYEIFVLPATAWQSKEMPFSIKNYDKPGQVSKPEFGITFSQKALEYLSSLSLPVFLSSLT